MPETRADARLDPATCPLCQRPNGCAVVAGQDAQTCWCQHQTFDADLLARVPRAAQGLACICPACAQGAAAPAAHPTAARP